MLRRLTAWSFELKFRQKLFYSLKRGIVKAEAEAARDKLHRAKPEAHKQVIDTCSAETVVS
jgi:hypothetical protein